MQLYDVLCKIITTIGIHINNLLFHEGFKSFTETKGDFKVKVVGIQYFN